ncbi:hypothetical protein D3C85_1470330 [compost metagenome]
MTSSRPFIYDSKVKIVMLSSSVDNCKLALYNSVESVAVSERILEAASLKAIRYCAFSRGEKPRLPLELEIPINRS